MLIMQDITTGFTSKAQDNHLTALSYDMYIHFCSL